MEESVDNFRRELAVVLRRAESLPSKTINQMTFDYAFFMKSARDILGHLGVSQDRRGNFLFEEK